MFERFTNAQLRSLLLRYPWYVALRYEMVARGILQDNDIAAYVNSTGLSVGLIETLGYHHFNPSSVEPMIEDYEIEHQRDISLDSVAPDQELVSETLAEIYLSQGLLDQAREVYAKLSLIFPEKSVYFASRIEQIGK